MEINSLGHVVTENITVIPPMGSAFQLKTDGTYHLLNSPIPVFVEASFEQSEQEIERRYWEMRKRLRSVNG